MKLTTTILLAFALIACQGEISAQTDVETAVETGVESAVDSAEAAVESATESLSEAAESTEAVTELEASEPVVTTPKQSLLEPDPSKYTALSSPIEPTTGEKIEVTELFWYGCGHCFALEPHVKNWQERKSENAEFVKVPAIFSKRWEFHGKAFYTMEALGVLKEANDGFFHSIHVKRKPINTLDQLVEFLADYDQSEEEVTAAFNSFAVDSKLRNAKILTAKSTASGVPAILVDGKYHTSVSMAGSADNLFRLVDQLVEKAAAER